MDILSANVPRQAAEGQFKTGKAISSISPNNKQVNLVQKKTRGRIYPSWENIDQLRNPLEPGERYLAKFLDDHLPAGWEIYVQPFLNGDRPDIIVMHPEIGVMIYEVKDWDLNHYRFDSGELMVRDGRGAYPVLSPVKQVAHYRENIIGLYIPQIGETIDENPKAFGVIKTGVYFHRASGQKAKALFDEKYTVIIGNDDLVPNNLRKILPHLAWSRSNWMNQEWAEHLRKWLIPPMHSQEQYRPLILNKTQLDCAEPTTGHHRLRGVAGSGKTAVLAWRAAKLASQNKRVLVICFNITLWHYIRDLVQRAPFKFSRDLIEYRHFHGFCKRVLTHYEEPLPAQQVDEATYFEKVVPEVVLQVIHRRGLAEELRYDAILIDEGQDFCWEWYNLLCCFLTERDEMLMVFDQNQNIYRRQLDWVDGQMKNVKFRGRWRELKQTMRLPKFLVDKVNQFSQNFLHSGEVLELPESQQLGFNDPELWWTNCVSENQALAQLWDVYSYLTNKKGFHPSDIVILLPSHKAGLEVVKFFEERNVRVNHVFEDEEEERPKHHKHAFWMGDARLKMSTIHSFKGWEITNVVLVIPERDLFNGISLSRQIFAALTRMAQPSKDSLDRSGCLMVFNCNVGFNDYGQSWPKQWPIKHGTLL